MMTGSMSVTEALETRFTCRAFLPDPVSLGVVRDILTRAIRAPSGGNIQPQHLWVLAGEELHGLTKAVVARVEAGEIADGPMEFEMFPQSMKEPYLARRIGIGQQMYGALEIARDDARARGNWFAKNMSFFDAPIGIFVGLDRQMSHPQWSDLGMYVMAVMLMAREYDLQASALEAWALFPRTVSAYLGMPPEVMLFCGVALGRPDMSHPVNKFRAQRASLDDFAQFRGFGPQ